MPEPRTSDVAPLLEYARRLSDSTTADIEHEYQQLLATAPEDRGYDDRVRQALLVILAPRRDSSRQDAETLLRDVLADGETPAQVRTLVDLLLTALLAPRVPDARGAWVGSAPAAVDTAALDLALRELADERAKRIELERMLEALGDLERQLNQRTIADTDGRD